MLQPRPQGLILANTAERIRTKYLLPHIEWLLQKQAEMEANAANLNARERKLLDSIGKQIAECREYHDRLRTVADEQIDFDQDDGVVVNYAKFGDVYQGSGLVKLGISLFLIKPIILEVPSRFELL